MNKYIPFPLVVIILLFTSVVFFSIGYNYGYLIVGKETKEVIVEDTSSEITTSGYKELQEDFKYKFIDYPLVRDRYLNFIKSKLQDNKITDNEYLKISW